MVKEVEDHALALTLLQEELANLRGVPHKESAVVPGRADIVPALRLEH